MGYKSGGGFLPVIAGWNGPTNGLTNRWPLDLAHFVSGADDDVVGTNNITENGTITSTTGPSGAANAARLFDGSSGYGTFTAPLFPSEATCTWAIWAYTSDVTHDVASTFSQTLMNSGNSGSGGFRVACDIGNPPGVQQGAFALQGIPTNPDIETSAIAFVNNQWVQVGFTWDGSSVCQLIINGTTVSTVAGYSLAVQSLDILGGRSSTTGLWLGAMAQMVLYNRVLSSSELTQLYNAF
jgi:Concanavalin A-like lectin/glucanases superfamily